MKILYIKGSAYWLFEGTMEAAKKIPGSLMHKPWIGTLGPNALQAQKRPYSYNDIPGREQWAIDKELGILDWSGTPES